MPRINPKCFELFTVACEAELDAKLPTRYFVVYRDLATHKFHFSHLIAKEYPMPKDYNREDDLYAAIMTYYDLNNHIKMPRVVDWEYGDFHMSQAKVSEAICDYNKLAKPFSEGQRIGYKQEMKDYPYRHGTVYERLDLDLI
jgi:hypothetical protein